ncbi:hypothetical protein K438DRAFT_651422 [Mycena galopus ATCC 62051]|nr:hypothetical protein K438DRAFT_651422 [Mycena galopus ATCC 62051]
MVDYLEAKRLRYLQQALDPDSSGLSTINEVNSFTQSCSPGWSVPRWISYWAVGWQIFATRYCSELDRIFTQMVLIREKVGIFMPGNKLYVNDYIRRIWPLVNTLTGGLERFDGSDWLAEKFQDYINREETKLQSGLEAIQYRIDSMEIVNELLTGSLIERSIFMLLAIVMRRHLNKMHMCLRKELNEAELDEDKETVMYVVDVAWSRHNSLAETYKHQQVVDMDRNFEWFSCGLVEYHEWKDWSNYAYYRSHDVFVYSGGFEIAEVNEKELEEKILRYDVGSSAPQVITSKVDTNPQKSRITEAISGTWFGFHCTEPEVPRSGMVRVNLQASKATDQTGLTISGKNTEAGNRVLATVEGRLTAEPGAQELELALSFTVMYSYGDYTYSGVLDVEREVISGTFQEPDSNGSFFLKKTPRADILCHRPLHARLTPAELWSLLRNAVLGTLRRQRPSSEDCTAHIKMIRRTLELISSTGEPSSKEEVGELGRLKKRFTVDEWMEIVKLSNWYDRVGDLNPGFWCSSCGGYLKRSRVVCMDCKPKGNTVDFDNKEECITTPTVVDTDGSSVPNHPTHLLLKTRDSVLLNEFPALERRARHCATIAASVFPTVPPKAKPTLASTISAPEGLLAPKEQPTAQVPTPDIHGSVVAEDVSENDGKPSVMKCLICQEPVSAPCWYCIDCPEKEAFICLSCETRIDDLLPWEFQKRYRDEVKHAEKHNVFHLLIRFNLPPSVLSENNVVPHVTEEEMDRRLRALEERLLGTLADDRAQLEARLAKMEAHLQAIVATL